MSYENQDILTLYEHMASPSIVGGVRVPYVFIFLGVVFVFVFVLCLGYAMLPVILGGPLLEAISVYLMLLHRNNKHQ